VREGEGGESVDLYIVLFLALFNKLFVLIGALELADDCVEELQGPALSCLFEHYIIRLLKASKYKQFIYGGYYCALQKIK
jgi:hypothetical protein